MKLKTSVAIVAVAALLSACGGGGGSPGTNMFGSSSSSSSSTTSGSTSTATNSSGAIVLSISTQTISSSSPGVVTALVKDSAGAVVPGAVVTFAVTDSALATLSSNSGMTNSIGEASTTVSPKAGVSTGATYVTASVTLPGTSSAITAQYAFSVSNTNVALTSVTPGQSSLNAYASTGVTVVVSAATSAAPVTVLASSTCATQGKATISPSTLTMTSTSSSFTYQDKGCGASDQVNVQIQGTSQTSSTTLVVAAPTATSLAFVSATPTTLCLMGSGCSATSTVKFRVVDSGGNGIPTRQTVDFTLDQPASASLSATSGDTDSDGYVSVVVTSKTQPSPVRVTAALHSDANIKTVSNALTILAGLPYQSGMSFAAVSKTVNFNLDGDSTALTVRLTDRFGNPVPDGTVVSYMTEGGSVTPGTCSTTAGACSVNFVVQNPRPANGRVTVVAYAQGEEDFVDADNSNTYNNSESFTDSGKVFVDSNENSTIDSNERTVGAIANAAWDSNAYVRSSMIMVMSETASSPRLFTVSGNACTTTPFTGVSVNLSATCSQTVYVCVKDGNLSGGLSGAGNPIVSGSTLAMTADISDVTATIYNTPIGATDILPTIHPITISRKTCATRAATDGVAKLSITVKGKVWSFDPSYDITIVH